jgi:hypothetical protein
MNAIKTLLAVSVLAGAGAANAAIWNISANGSQFFDASGDLSVSYTGTWNDVTGEGSLTGVGTIGLYGLSADLTQTFKMLPGGTGKGVLRQASGATGSCTDTIGGGVCTGLVGNFKGTLYNNMTYAGGANNTTGTATPFSVGPTGGSWTWSFLVQTSQTTDPDTGDVSTFYAPYALHVTASSAPAVPVPAAAWLFGSGLLGLAGAARRRRS